MRPALAWTSLLAIPAALLTTAPSAHAAAAASAVCTPAQTAALQVLQGRLDHLAATHQAGKGQYWGIDPAACTVRVAVLRGATDPATTRFIAAATATVGLATVTYTDTPITTTSGVLVAAPAHPNTPRHRRLAITVSGGQAIYSGTSGTVIRCTTGFNELDSSQQPFSHTAGHCINDGGGQWYDSSGNQLFKGASYQFPGRDYADISRVSSSISLPSTVINGTSAQNITSFNGTPTIGENACKTGSTTGTTCGTVQGLNYTANYAEGAVNGLIYTNISSAQGDSGGPLFDGSTALGLVSGGDSGGTVSLYQPIRF